MPAPEPVTTTAPRPARPALVTTSWRDVAFLHWPLDPARAAPLLPPGTRPDLFGGVTYVGLVPLRMRRTGLLGLPAAPYLGSFAEVNVRLYSVDEQGRRGIVFLRMDADRLVPVLAARAGPGLPYTWSRTRVRRDADRRIYTVRAHAGAARARIVLRVEERKEPDPLDLFLTARWGMHHRLGHRTLYGPVAHDPWPLHAAELLELDTDLLEAAGLPPAKAPPFSVLFAPAVDRVRFGPPLR